MCRVLIPVWWWRRFDLNKKCLVIFDKITLQTMISFSDTVKVEIFARLVFRAQPRKMNFADNKLEHANTHFDIIFARFYFRAWPFCRKMRKNFPPAKISTFMVDEYSIDELFQYSHVVKIKFVHYRCMYV